MGSGRSGAGGGGGGGGTTFRLPIFSFGHTATNKPTTKSKVEAEVQRVIRNLKKEFLIRLFGSPVTRMTYEHLFTLNVEIFENRGWNGIEKRYGVKGGSQCLYIWATVIAAKYDSEEPDEKVRDTVQVALEDFLVHALNMDADVYRDGTSDKILARLDDRIFKSTSAFFLGHLIWRMLERHGEAMPDDVEIQLVDVAQDKADEIVRGFDNKFHNKVYGDKRITHRDLFLIIQENMPWFIEELRR